MSHLFSHFSDILASHVHSIYSVNFRVICLCICVFGDLTMSNYLWYVVSFILANSWDKRKAKKKKAFMNLVFVDIMFAFIMRICLSIIVEIRISSMFNDTAWRPKNLILLPFQKLYLIVLNFLLHLHVISNKCPSTVFVSVLIIIRYMLIHFFLKINGTQYLKLWTPLYQLYVMYIAGEICPKISIDH